MSSRNRGDIWDVASMVVVLGIFVLLAKFVLIPLPETLEIWISKNLMKQCATVHVFFSGKDWFRFGEKDYSFDSFDSVATRIKKDLSEFGEGTARISSPCNVEDKFVWESCRKDSEMKIEVCQEQGEEDGIESVKKEGR